MASSQTASNDSSAANDKGSAEGRVYENLSLLLLAKNGYELSKDNAKFRDFSIGREIKNLGRDMKFDDNVFMYTEMDGSKNFIFVQVKHIQKEHRIDSRDFSVGAARAKRGKGLGKSREFNLQKYFISFLSVREELEYATSEELKNGVIKYVAIFTNAGLDAEELRRKGFSLKEAPEDIAKLFTVKSKEAKDFYQICKVSEHLHDVLMKSSDLYRLARELAPYIVWKSYREKNIMKNDASPLKHYHVPLAREVFQKSAQSAQFRNDFLENDETNSKQELRSAIFEAIRELDASKKSLTDDEMKKLLKGTKWKVDPNFGETGQDDELNFPSKWKTVKEEDIKEFLKCLVLIVNRPRVEDLEAIILRSVQDTMVDSNYSTSLRYIVDNLDKTFPELKEHLEQDLGIYEATNFEEGWTSGAEIVKFIEKQKQQIGVSFFATAMTLMYESEVMQFGKFKETQAIETCLKNFFSSSAQILCVKSPQTLLSSNKILQYLNSKTDCIAEEGRIYANFDTLKSKENRDSTASAFELERNDLLVIEHRHAVSEQDMEEIYKNVYSVVSTKPNKKVIFIIPEDEQNSFWEKFQNDIQNKDNFMLEYDVIDVTDFEPKEDPFKKEVILFQGQLKKVSLCEITRIDSWTSYVHSSFQGTNREDVMDGMTLVQILNSVEVKVGSKPTGTSSLEGAYAQMYEEINIETLVDRLTSREHGHDANDVYVISGITGSSKLDKKNKLIQFLGLSNKKEVIEDQLGYIDNDKKIQIADGQFKHKDFQSLCHHYPKKRIFWISVKWENDVMKLILQETYNPNFYLKRKFRNVIIKKDLKEHLIKEDLSETFIFHCVEDKQRFYKLMELNEAEKEQFENNRKIMIFSQKSDAEATFRQLCGQNKTIHSLEVKETQLVLCESHGSVECLQKYIEHQQGDRFLIEEDKLITKIKDRKAVIFADDPGMGKTTTLINLYETELEPSSVIQSHWVINIKLKDHLETLLDHEFEKDGIGNLDVIEFLSNIDSELNNNLAKNLLKIVLDKNKSFQAKPLLLIFDGFDEVLDEKVRRRILLLIQFIKDETPAKLWITTRCHFKTHLEQRLSTIAFQFSPMDDSEKAQYIATYLQHRLYLTLNKNKYTELFDTDDKKQNNEKINLYTAAFINKIKFIFRGDIATFIGTPLQLYLLLEGAVEDFKNWIEGGGGTVPDLKYICNDVCEVYENFVNRKYGVYFQKTGNRVQVKQEQEKLQLDEVHKKFAQSKIFEVNPKYSLGKFKNIYLLVGVMMSQGNGLEFIHKTFEEFFSSKAFIDWIINPTETDQQEYLLTVILLKPDYKLVRTFINLQLQKLSKQSTKGEGYDGLNESHKHYGKTLAKLLTKKNSPLIDVKGTPLHIAVIEGNKNIAFFLLNSLNGHPDALRKCLFTAGVNVGRAKESVLHLACRRDDFEIVKVLLDAAERISEDTLQEFLKCLSNGIHNALFSVAHYGNNVHIFNELLSRANSKLDVLIFDKFNALCVACSYEKKEFVDLLLQEFQHEKHSLKTLLLYSDYFGNVLCHAKSIDVVEKLIAAAKSIEDNNETLKNMLLPEESEPPLNRAVSQDEKDKFEKLLNAAREIDDDNQTLIQMLMNERYKTTPLHVAARWGRGDYIKLLLETASDLGLDILEKLITAIDEKGRNAIDLMFEEGHETIIGDSFKMLEEDKYENIRKKVMEMSNNVPLEIRLEPTKEKLTYAIRQGHIMRVKKILRIARNSSDYPNECLRNLLSGELPMCKRFGFRCRPVYRVIIKELLSNAVNVDDGGATLKAFLTNIYRNRYMHTCQHRIKEIVESHIFETETKNRMQAITILTEIKEQFTGGQPSEIRLNIFRRTFRRIVSYFNKSN